MPSLPMVMETSAHTDETNCNIRFMLPLPNSTNYVCGLNEPWILNRAMRKNCVLEVHPGNTELVKSISSFDADARTLLMTVREGTTVVVLVARQCFDASSLWEMASS